MKKSLVCVAVTVICLCLSIVTLGVAQDELDTSTLIKMQQVSDRYFVLRIPAVVKELRLDTKQAKQLTGRHRNNQFNKLIRSAMQQLHSGIRKEDVVKALFESLASIAVIEEQEIEQVLSKEQMKRYRQLVLQFYIEMGFAIEGFQTLDISLHESQAKQVTEKLREVSDTQEKVEYNFLLFIQSRKLDEFIDGKSDDLLGAPYYLPLKTDIRDLMKATRERLVVPAELSQ